MNYARFIKPLRLPPGFAAPSRLWFEELEARAISRADLDDDVRGINQSIELIRRTRGGGWPTEPVSEDHNYVDLVWHEQEFREQTSFTYAVYDQAGGYVGCCYLAPLGCRTPLTEQLLDCDVDISWWVTPGAYARGQYATLYRALRYWAEKEYAFEAPHYSNREIPLVPLRADVARPQRAAQSGE
ncbi:hypothetical protein GCM10009868_38710 [Terrabacter aerolatus]|uniref:N-acetyltransferase domain-containing protein n=1 Tax=Terrabacter aerolatus TaxID=422442 RepID=A0A512D0K5_9MICO|nr:GNAT family N-acetyltransferase [Terrabacter aerolatus]GEO29996.1 hypothetical protein TAE01_18060 [Terrabacter aerolatus]